MDAALGRTDKFTLHGDDYPTADGTCVRDYIHITDLARAHLLALDAVHLGEHKIYNLGNGIGFTNPQVVQAIRDVTGVPFDIETGPRRPGDPATLYASSERARAELGWSPRIPGIHDIVGDAWRFHRQTPPSNN